MNEAYPKNAESARPERRRVSRRSVIEAAKEKVATIDLANLLCGPGKMRRIGSRWVGGCPLPDHEDKTPSFTVYLGTNSWFCYGCLRGGDVVELARYGWGYDESEVATAAAMLLMEFGHEVPQRPPTWFRRQERQRPVRDAIEEARIEVMARRLWRWVFAPILAEIEDADERVRMAGELWAKVVPLATRLVEARRSTA